MRIGEPLPWKHWALIPEGSGEKSIDRDSRHFLSVDAESFMYDCVYRG